MINNIYPDNISIYHFYWLKINIFNRLMMVIILMTAMCPSTLCPREKLTICPQKTRKKTTPLIPAALSYKTIFGTPIEEGDLVQNLLVIIIGLVTMICQDLGMTVSTNRPLFLSYWLQTAPPRPPPSRLLLARLLLGAR